MKLSNKMLQILEQRKKELQSKCIHGWAFCECFKIFDLELKFARAKIPIKFWHWSFDKYDPMQERAKEYKIKILKYLESQNLKKAHDKGIGFYFQGGNGLGKTLLVCLTLQEAIKQGYSARFTTLTEIVDMLTAGWYSEEKKRDFVTEMREIDFLGIDDVGREFEGKDSSLISSSFDNLFRERANNCLPTFITSNIPMNQINNKYAEGLFSLFSEHLIPLIFHGKDRRTDKIAPELEKDFLI